MSTRTQKFYTTGAGYDTGVYYGSPDSDYGSGNFLNWWYWHWIYVDDRKSALLKFDFSSLSLLPNETIVGATMTLTGSSSATSGAPTSYAYRILPANSTWNASSTWNYKTPNTVRWAGDAGGDGGLDAGCSASGVDHSATVLCYWTHINDTGYKNIMSLNLEELELMLANNCGLIIEKHDSNIWENTCWSGNVAVLDDRPVIELTIVTEECEMHIGSYNVPMPTSIEDAAQKTLVEYDKVSNTRGITARGYNYSKYSLKWKILSKDILANFTSAKNQTFPVPVTATNDLFNFSGFITDYKVQTVHDVPPFYEVSMTIESDV